MTGVDESLQTFNEFLCPECDKAKANSKVTLLSKQESGNCETMKPALLILWQPLLSKFLSEEVSDRVQVCSLTCIQKSGFMEIKQLVFMLNLAFLAI